MRKFLMTMTVVAGAVLAAAQAEATEFVGSWSTPVLQTSDPGLIVGIDPIHPTFDFTLNPASPSTTINLFTIYTNEAAVNADDTVLDPIRLTFNFSSPTPNSVDPIDGSTYGQASLFGVFQNGALTWTTGETDLNFGNGLSGLLTINVNGGTFNQGLFGLNDGTRRHPASDYGLTVSATFDWVNDATASVPEPASWALMIGGFGMTGVMLRRRKLAAATA